MISTPASDASKTATAAAITSRPTPSPPSAAIRGARFDGGSERGHIQSEPIVINPHYCHQYSLATVNKRRSRLATPRVHMIEPQNDLRRARAGGSGEGARSSDGDAGCG